MYIWVLESDELKFFKNPKMFWNSKIKYTDQIVYLCDKCWHFS